MRYVNSALLKKQRKHSWFLQVQMRLYNAVNFHQKGNSKDIFLFSSVRSGSTWLEKIIVT